MMKVPNRNRRLTTAVLIAVTAILVLLAAYQYVWSEQAMRASTARMASLLRSSMLDWHMEFFHQFSDLCLAMRVNPDPSAFEEPATYARRFQQWRATAEFPELASNLYIWKLADGATEKILRLNMNTLEFAAATWSPKLEPLRAVLKARSNNLELAMAASSEPETLFSPAQKQPFKVRDQGVGDAFAGWLFEADIPALVHAIPPRVSSNTNDKHDIAQPADWIVIEQIALTWTDRNFAAEASDNEPRGGVVRDDRVLYESALNPRTSIAASAVALSWKTSRVVIRVIVTREKQRPSAWKGADVFR